MYKAYIAGIAQFVAFLKKHQIFLAANILGTFLTEPSCSLYLGLVSPLGYIQPFTFYGLNPDVLTPEDAHKPPVLLIHGNHSNQSVWLSFAKTLQKQGLKPVYTINTSSNQITEEELLLLDKKLSQIQKQYEKLGVPNVKIDLIGHSRGGKVAHVLKGRHPEKIGKIISLGSPLTAEEMHLYSIDNTYEITGEYDVLTCHSSLLPPERSLELKTGHLGLLFSKEAETQVMRWLQIF